MTNGKIPKKNPRKNAAKKKPAGRGAATSDSKLIIVESPAKARTISRFLGQDYIVEASFGHIRDLPASASEIPDEVKGKPWARLGVDPENDFKPVYVESKDSHKRISALKKKVKNAGELLLATDEDREGESIAWHLLETLGRKIPYKRITFHEITRGAIENALDNPYDEINTRLVQAQESRRILDRLFGYKLSPIIWKKVRPKLSAGRVQSVAVRLIEEREEERRAFRQATYWDIEARMEADEQEFKTQLIQIGDQRICSGKDFDASTGNLKKDSRAIVLDERSARDRLDACMENLPWHVSQIQKKETQQRPAPPFTTSTLQQAASSRLKLTPRQSMMIAQRLYEGIDLGGEEREGLITYMRTDSVTLSEKALKESSEFIGRTYGSDYCGESRRYKTKSKSAQEAHEAIRPTNFRHTPDSLKGILRGDELELYSLIWDRMIASQMPNAILDKTSVDFRVTIDKQEHIYRANGSVVRFPGYLRAWSDEQRDSRLPAISEKDEVHSPSTGGTQRLLLKKLMPIKHETSPPARYTEASLVRKLEEEGIGRPSTYAPTISTIQNREYVIKKNGYLVPSWIGMAVTHLLSKHFKQYIDIKFTAGMEEDLDKIASGEMDSTEFLSDFYRGAGKNRPGLLKQIEGELPRIEYPAIILGNDPDTQEPIQVRIGRTAAYVQRGDGGSNNTATLPDDLMIDEMTCEKALELLRVGSKSREPLGKHPDNGENIYALIGPYGPYVQLGESEGKEKPKRVSLPRGKAVESLKLTEALRYLLLPRDLGECPDTGKTVRAGLGRYGPYVERDRVYQKLDSEDEMFTVQLKEAVERLNAKNKAMLLKDLGVHPDTGENLQVLKGRYGPYIKHKTVNASLPKGTDPESIDMKQALQYLEEASRKKSHRTPKKTAAKKKTASKKTSAKKPPKKIAPKKTAAKKKFP